jgi:NAD(P)-dependent dehydrogenase (short-subunit alcohol dehydrogenase family)
VPVWRRNGRLVVVSVLGERFVMSRLIVAGATGSLGRHVVRQAIAAGHEVTVFVRTPSKLPPACDRAMCVLPSSGPTVAAHGQFR